MNLAIVNTIKNQLYAFGKMKVWSWGTRNFVAMDEYTLRFRVSGHHHKGYVQIFLNGMDTYDIKLLKLNGDVKKEFKGIFFDEMTNVIDEAVEKIPAYKR
jgi:hypothetical protein